jgi:phage terminase large subunit
LSFQYTTAIDKLRDQQEKGKRFNVVPGGTSAGKTFGILPVLIEKAINNSGLEISVVSESVPHLRKGALKDFLKIMKSSGRYIDKNYNRTLLTYTFTSGSYIEFFSAQEDDKVRGPRRTDLYINEANNIKFETFHQLSIRTSGQIWIDFNPTNSFWAHEELKNDPDADWLTLTYLDNEGLPETIVKEIEKAKGKAFKDPTLSDDKLFQEDNVLSSYWCNWWKVYGLGQVGTLEGVIFSNWSIIDELPEGAKPDDYGLDFGYTNDPTGCVMGYTHNGKEILDEVEYQTGLLNSDIFERLTEYGINKRDKGFADSAEPKSIAELEKMGLHIEPVEKGPDSIKFGIDLMQQEHFYVTSRSVNLIEELRNYCWDTDKTGKSLNKPVDAFNHLIDAARYRKIMKRPSKKRKVRAKTY